MDEKTTYDLIAPLPDILKSVLLANIWRVDGCQGREWREEEIRLP
jgi:hypothetical protein